MCMMCMMCHKTILIKFYNYSSIIQPFSTGSQWNSVYNKIYRAKSIPMTAYGVRYSVIMAKFIMPETQQPIILLF